MSLIWEISFLLKHDRQHDSATCIKNRTNIYILGHFDGQREHRTGRQGPTPVPSIYFTPSLRDVWKGNCLPSFHQAQNNAQWSWNAVLPGAIILVGSKVRDVARRDVDLFIFEHTLDYLLSISVSLAHSVLFSYFFCVHKLWVQSGWCWGEMRAAWRVWLGYS